MLDAVYPGVPLEGHVMFAEPTAPHVCLSCWSQSDKARQ